MVKNVVKYPQMCLLSPFYLFDRVHTKIYRLTCTEDHTRYNQIKGEQFPWCYEVTKCAPEQAFADLGQAFANYWRMKEEGTQPKLKHPRKDGEEAGFPRFKSKK